MHHVYARSFDDAHIARGRDDDEETRNYARISKFSDPPLENAVLRKATPPSSLLCRSFYYGVPLNRIVMKKCVQQYSYELAGVGGEKKKRNVDYCENRVVHFRGELLLLMTTKVCFSFV